VVLKIRSVHGINPIHAIKKKDEGKTTRTVSDSEIRRIKQAFLIGEDGKRTQIGVMMCLLMDFALLTAQRAKDVRLLKWSDIKAEGILFKPSKTAASTGERILIEWTPKLRAIIERIKAEKVTHQTMVFTNSKRQPLSASAMTQAWAAAMERCTKRGTLPLENRPQFRQLRRTAITEVVRATGRGWADGQAMGAHASVKQTEDYVASEVVFITKQTKAAR
jgi:integrase